MSLCMKNDNNKIAKRTTISLFFHLAHFWQEIVYVLTFSELKLAYLVVRFSNTDFLHLSR